MKKYTQEDYEADMERWGKKSRKLYLLPGLPWMWASTGRFFSRAKANGLNALEGEKVYWKTLIGKR